MMSGYGQDDAIFNPLNSRVIFSFPERLVDPRGWVEHIPFAMVLVEITQPSLLVELGTHIGNSYCAFCQAVKELNIDTKCYAIDTWKGDAHAGYYGSEVLDELKQHHDARYKSFSQLLQTTFDEAVNKFADCSIDLLHIDGLHTYEAVKHDFETWLPKLSRKGVVLFHDISVRENNFGVWKLWDELKLNYSTFEFIHGNGLGVLTVSEEYPPSLDMIIKSPLGPSKIQELFYQLGHRLDIEMYAQTLFRQLAEENQTIRNLTDQVAETNQTIQTLTAQVTEYEQTTQILTSQLSQTRTELEQLKKEALRYALSRSWRFTRPLRKLNKFIKRKKNV